MPARLYSPRHIGSAALHYSAQIATGAGALMFAPFWAVGAGIAVTAGVLKLSLDANKKVLENDLKQHPDKHPHAPYLGQMVKELYQKSGLDSDDYPVYDFKPKQLPPQIGKKRSVTDSIKDMLTTTAKTPNAAAFHMDKPVIMISEPLLELLDDHEQKAVLAHEFAHAAARHQHLSMPQAFIASSARIAAGLAQLTAFIKSGLGAIAGIGTALGIEALIEKYHPKGHLLRDQNPFMTLPEKHEKMKLLSLTRTFGNVAGVGAVSLFYPAFLPIWAGAKAVTFSSQLISKSQSRSMEYQADKGAVTLGASPLALIMALRKMEALIKRSVKKEWGNNPLPEKGKLTSLWNELNATHPTLNKRIGQLTKIARQNGFAEHAIHSATHDPVDISHAPDVPPDVAQAMALRINGAAPYPGMAA